jgi:hypothetical protein
MTKKKKVTKKASKKVTKKKVAKKTSKKKVAKITKSKKNFVGLEITIKEQSNGTYQIKAQGDGAEVFESLLAAAGNIAKALWAQTKTDTPTYEERVGFDSFIAQAVHSHLNVFDIRGVSEDEIAQEIEESANVAGASLQ